MSAYQKYTELDVWKHARALASYTYELTSTYPKSEQFGIVSQIRRCVVSVPSNIAEGCGRQHKKETIQFLTIARGSLYELETQLYISKDLSYITEDQLSICLNKIENLGKLLNGFIRYNTEKKEA
ncbi:four helix bundle protein [Daejeonella rubra]|uniref:Four helix bundle protein n=1 Tax=Daejeonella rubra TaxID=990371 RepID=A0A1G9NS95_9SPHI|nr:four helix bundle protein [Daejeonella rubra]SDL88855.1 four helix bundle protein [Daejeonella rubra]